MKRKIDLKSISDGRLYTSNDMVKADCNGCNGCSSCCRGMGSSIVLDPFDVYRMTEHLGVTFSELLKSVVELNVVDGVILPNMKMVGTSESCAFLNQEGRCTIHSVRPGVCRLFPLGRFYEDGSFRYFLQVQECPKENKTKVKVKKWVDTPNLKEYEQFVTDWHYFLDSVEEVLKNAEEIKQRRINMYLLKCFYMQSYPVDIDFYETFYKRLNETKKMLKMMEETGRC